MKERHRAEPQRSENDDLSSKEKEESKPSSQEEKNDDAQPDEKRKSEEDGEDDSKPFRPSRKALVIGGIIVAIIIVGGILYWLHARNFVSTDDAYTVGHVHQVSSRVPGTVIELKVDDNQHVKTGDVVVRLDPRDFEVALQKAKAALGQAQAQAVRQVAAITQAHSQVSASDAQILQAKAQVDQEAAQFERARLDYERISGLYTKDIRAVSKADVDAAKASFDATHSMLEGAEAGLAAAKAQAEAARANLQSAEAQLAVDKAGVTASEANAHDAELQLSYCDVISPVDGKVSKRTVETGQRLQPGEALMAIVPDGIWILANLKETQLERVRIGQRVNIKIDTLPHYQFYGSVNSIQEGSGATFSLLPPDNATGNFTKIVQRVPVKIVFDEESIRDFRDKIIPGLSVEPSIDLTSLRDDSHEAKRTEREEKQNREVEGHR